MRRWALALGIIVIFIGVVLTPSSSIPQKVTNSITVSDVERSWSTSGEFKKNEILTLDLSPHADWSLYPYPDVGGPTRYSKCLAVNITSPVSQNYTTIEAYLVPPGTVSTPPPEGGGFILVLYEIRVSHQGLLITEDSPNDITGVIREDGLYVANCSLIPPVVNDLDPATTPPTPYVRKASAPAELRLTKETVKTTYPYYFLLPVGVPTIVIGVVLSAWGSRRDHQRHQKQIGKSIR